MLEPSSLNSPKEPPPVAQVKKAREAKPISPDLLKRLNKVIALAIKSLNRAWNYIKNPVDHDWRKNQKYNHLMQELCGRIEEQLVDSEIPQPKVKQLIDLIKKTPGRPIHTENAPKGSMLECRRHLEKALRKLYDPELQYDSYRERYKAFTESYLRALSTSYYKNLVKEDQGGLSAEAMRALEQSNPIIGALHAIAYAQFSQVNTLGFTQSVAEEMAIVGGYHDRPNIEEVTGSPETKRQQLLGLVGRECSRTHKASVAIDRSDSRYNISWWTKLGATIKGHMSFMDFDPLHTGGNPVNIHHRRQYSDGREVTFIRLPSPTIGSEISPDFKAYLRALKSRGEKHGYFNLQDRRTIDQLPKTKEKIKASMGFPREDLRVDSIENLHTDPEFAGVIFVITLDKNSPFYWQHDKKAGLELLDNLVGRNIINKPEKIANFKKGLNNKNQFSETFDQLLGIYHRYSKDHKTDPVFAMQQKNAFISDFKNNIFGKSPSFYIPKDILDVHREGLERLLDNLADLYIRDRTYLSPRERQNFIELSYDLMTDYLVRELKVNYANISCKDCIDRGEGQMALKEGKDLIMEILSSPDGNYREGLLHDIQAWHDTVHAAAIWARKRHMLPEREVRLINAMECMLSMVKNHPEGFQRINQEAQQGIPRVDAPVNKKQRVVAFRQEMTGFPEQMYNLQQHVDPTSLTGLFDQAVTSGIREVQAQPPTEDHILPEDEEVQ